MTGQRNVKRLLQMIIVILLIIGSAEAKGIEAGLWGLGWDADPGKVKQTLEGQGFSLLDQGRSTGGIWQSFGNGKYGGFPCQIKVQWHNGELTEISIESAGGFVLGTEFGYRNLVSKFSEQYGQPDSTEAYMLKIFPGVWVERSSWAVAAPGMPAYNVTLEQNSVANRPTGQPDQQEKIIVMFQRGGGTR